MPWYAWLAITWVLAGLNCYQLHLHQAAKFNEPSRHHPAVMLAPIVMFGPIVMFYFVLIAIYVQIARMLGYG